MSGYDDDRPLGEQVARVRERLHATNEALAIVSAKAEQIPGLVVHVQVLQSAVERLGSTVSEISTASARRGATMEAALGHFVELRSRIEGSTPKGQDQDRATREAFATIEATLRAAIEESRKSAEDPIARDRIKHHDARISGLQTAEKRLTWGMISLLILVVGALLGLLIAELRG